jgi:hypothetical protein
MKRSLLMFVAIALMASLSFATVAVAAPPAPKPVTMAIEAAEGLLADAVAALQAQINSLADRLGIVESKVAALEAAGGGSGGSDDFWPELTYDFEPRIRTEHTIQYHGDPANPGVWYAENYYFHFGLAPTVMTADGFRVEDYDSSFFVIVSCGDTRVMRRTWNWSETWTNNENWALEGWLPIEDRPQEGTPIRVEWWFESYGQQFHGVETIADWTWDTKVFDSHGNPL